MEAMSSDTVNKIRILIQFSYMYYIHAFARFRLIRVRACAGTRESTSAPTFRPNQLPTYILHLVPCRGPSGVRVRSRDELKRSRFIRLCCVLARVASCSCDLLGPQLFLP